MSPHPPHPHDHILFLGPQQTQLITGSEFPISFHLDLQTDKQTMDFLSGQSWCQTKSRLPPLGGEGGEEEEGGGGAEHGFWPCLAERPYQVRV